MTKAQTKTRRLLAGEKDDIIQTLIADTSQAYAKHPQLQRKMQKVSKLVYDLLQEQAPAVALHDKRFPAGTTSYSDSPVKKVTGYTFWDVPCFNPNGLPAPSATKVEFPELRMFSNYGLFSADSRDESVRLIYAAHRLFRHWAQLRLDGSELTPLPSALPMRAPHAEKEIAARDKASMDKYAIYKKALGAELFNELLNVYVIVEAIQRDIHKVVKAARFLREKSSTRLEDFIPIYPQVEKFRERLLGNNTGSALVSVGISQEQVAAAKRVFK